MHNLIQDLRFAWRLLRKSLGFSVVAIVTLALGIGVNTAMFGALNAFLLRPFPFRDPDQLTMVWEKNPKLEGFLAERVPTCLKNYFEWRDHAKSFSEMTAYQSANFALTGVTKPEQLDAQKVSADFFAMLGVKPEQGRTFVDDEGVPGKQRLVVLTHGFYEKHFGHDANVVDQVIQLDSQNYSIIGVLPSSFKLPANWGGLNTQKPLIFVPLNTSRNQDDAILNNRDLFVFARLKPGLTLENARAEMDVMGQRLEQKYPDLNQGFGVSVFPLRAEDINSDFHLGLFLLQGFVGLVLLIACANLANLLLARAAGREKELAVRVALGASRGRIIRQMLAESMLLSLAGGLVGLVLAKWGMVALNRFTPEDVLGSHQLTLDFSVFGFTFMVVALAGLIFGIVPALYASRQSINETLTRNSRAVTGRAGKMRSTLVVAEVTIAVLLVAGAGLMVRSLAALRNVKPGFDADHVLTAKVSLPPEKYQKPGQIQAFCAELLEKMRAIPGVQSAALAGGLPMSDVAERSFHLEGQPLGPGNDYLLADYAPVSDDYFAAMGTPVVQGRVFTRAEAEQTNPQVVMVNESMARKYWPDQSALGKVIITGPDKKPIRSTIVGIVADSHQLLLSDPMRPQMFSPSRTFSTPAIVLHVAGDPRQLSSALTAQVLSIDKDLPVNDIQSMAQTVAGTMTQERFRMSLMIAFAALALLLASVGLYGVLAYVVSQRTAEIGIRMALGAQRSDVMKMVLRHGMILAVTGVLIGVVAALASTQIMSSLLYGISARDPLTLLATSGILIVIALIATYVPARRATKVEPVIALRYD